MPEFMYKDDQYKAEPDNRDKFKAGKNDGSDWSRPMCADRNAPPVSKCKIALLPHGGIEPYFGDLTNRCESRSLKSGLTDS